MTPPVSVPQYEQDRDDHDSNMESAPPPAVDILAALAQEINACHRQCQSSAQMTLESAIATGKKLIAAKNTVKERKEKWNPWVAANCSFDVRQAQKYMRLAKNEKRFLENAPSGSLSGINAALEIIAKPRFEEKNAGGEAGDALLHDQTNADPASDLDVPAVAAASNGGGGQELDDGQDASVSAVSHGEDFLAVNASVAASADLQPSPALPINNAVSTTTDEQANMMPAVVEQGNSLDEMQRDKSEVLVALAKNTSDIVLEFVDFIAGEDWRQAPLESYHALHEALDRLIAVASQAKEFLHINN